MRVAPPPGPTGTSRVLLVALLVALAVGAASSLLIGAATSSGAPPPHISELFLPNALIAWAILVFLGLLIGLFVYQRLANGTVGVPSRAVANLLVVILILILLVAFFRVYTGGGPAPTGSVPISSNGTSPPPSLTNNSTAANLTPIGNVTPFLLPGVPPWVPFAVIAAAVVVIAVVAVPAARALVRSRREEGGPRLARVEAVRRVKAALEEAHRQLDLGDDPRRVIIALYTEFLERIAPLIGWVGPETPEEIRTRHLIALGIRSNAATALTRLFEEARYSSHALEPAHLTDAREAIRAAIEDLGNRPEAAR